METAIFKHIVDYTHDVVSSCKPRQLLYIGIDGVAPLAKISQQRKRRHLTALRNQLIYKYKSDNKIAYSKWDSNCITPGTTFMRSLYDYLDTHFKSLKGKVSYEIILSGDNEPGEGEHKIIKYIKDLGKDGFTDVIYGLDADLIMLSLTCKKEKMFLMRESNHITRHTPNDILSFKFVNIDVLRGQVGRYIAPNIQNIDGSLYNFMLDYVFICFLLGNDFLPHFASIDLKHNGLQMICETYKKMGRGFMIHLNNETGQYTLNLPFFLEFIKELATYEDDNLKFTIKQYYETPYIERAAKSPIERYVNEIDFLPMIKRKKPFDPATDPEWKNKYYDIFLRKSYSDIKAVNDVCENYLQGILWNIDYYFNNIKTNTWYYRHNAAPFVADILKYLQKRDTLEIPKHEDTQIKEIEQLLLVLPYHSLPLLPVQYQEIIKDISKGYAHLYPVSFQVNTFLKTQLWECTPYLPMINLDKIKQLVMNIES
jgi:5'-3' exonuclease